ncbi:MAG: biotin/lipoyl-binding protein [Actinobacteria bacterium]|nr:biotin/lipoyl-binding protein [Cyanobacteriota bacterium]MCL5770850.1 biotin/lipoyl-binding protein [Actinomycetota bacterium]
MFEVVIPKVGMSVTEVEITKWKVKKGDKVNKDDEIVEITMEKANTILTSEVSGIVEEILFNEGDTVKVGEVICRIRTE